MTEHQPQSVAPVRQRNRQTGKHGYHDGLEETVGHTVVFTNNGTGNRTMYDEARQGDSEREINVVIQKHQRKIKVKICISVRRSNYN